MPEAAAAVGRWETLVRGRVAGFAIVAAQLLVLYKVIERFNIETAAFRLVAGACVIGFAVHHWLPRAWKLPFFAALSLGSTLAVLGLNPGAWDPWLALGRGAWLFGIGLALIGICHLPLAFRTRVALLLLVGAGLAACRAGAVDVRAPAVIWPILGSMFMFRLAVYLYDLAHSEERPGVAQALAYFFMLPNACFPLFSVVDAKTFFRSPALADAFAVQQTGLSWILRGIVHLVLYRLVYYHVYVAPSQVASGADLALFLLSNLLLYLRVSGQFHLVVGLLHLFGFNLPLTNNRYFLASSFNDYWRRINIYWKDFIMKVVYYPTFFRIKRLGTTRAMLIATPFAFLVSWLLHSFQWFWLRGRFPIAAQDAIFWGTLGAAVTLNSWREATHGRRRTLGRRKPTAAERLRRGLGTAAIFGSTCLLWSLWTSPSVSDWVDLWSVADLDTLAWMAGALAVVALASSLPWLDAPREAAKPGSRAVPSPRAVAACALPALLLYGVGRSEVLPRLGPDAAGLARTLMEPTKPTGGDQQVMERGYYEELIDVGMLNSPLSELFMQRPADWIRLEQSPVMRATGDFLFMELVPGSDHVVNGVRYTINRHGMRDAEVEIAKPAGACRVALLGASTVMGHGVAAEETFERLLEERLGRERAGTRCARWELLDFGTNRMSPLSQVLTLERRALAFDPDVVLFFSHVVDPWWTTNHLARAVREGVALPDPFLADVARRAELGPTTSELAAERRLRPLWPELVSWAYRRVADASRASGALPVWVFMPRVGDTPERLGELPKLRALAAEAGFATIELTHVFDGVEIDRISIAAWDRHPNAFGHRLLADALYEALVASPDLAAVGLGPSAPDAAGARSAE